VDNKIGGSKWRKIREQVFAIYGKQCHYCGYEDEVMTVDHLLPRSRGGDNSLENLIPACRKCNYARGNKMDGFFKHGGTPPTLHGVNIPKNVSVSHD
jgi:5-methylcytosine-specific restriction endonuclease McrA